jgi:hypothetical protein
LGAKKVRFKAPIARDSGAIVKIGNTEAGFFDPKIQVHEYIRDSLTTGFTARPTMPRIGGVSIPSGGQ